MAGAKETQEPQRASRCGLLACPLRGSLCRSAREVAPLSRQQQDSPLALAGCLCRLSTTQGLRRKALALAQPRPGRGLLQQLSSHLGPARPALQEAPKRQEESHPAWLPDAHESSAVPRFRPYQMPQVCRHRHLRSGAAASSSPSPAALEAQTPSQRPRVQRQLPSTTAQGQPRSKPSESTPCVHRRARAPTSWRFRSLARRWSGPDQRACRALRASVR